MVQSSTNGTGASGTSEKSPRQIVEWALRRFAGRRLVITTGFGMEGCAMIDMIARVALELGIEPTVWHIDTGFLFDETHDLRQRLEAKYPNVVFRKMATDITPERQALEHGPELWKTNPDRCCAIRKVEPMRRLMMGEFVDNVENLGQTPAQADAWMTAVSRGQGASRAGTSITQWDAQFELVKISPLAAWSREQVLQYVLDNAVPYNVLHERGYPSIGCTHCTSPVAGSQLGEYSREGRWAGTTKTECGLHIDPAGENI